MLHDVLHVEASLTFPASTLCVIIVTTNGSYFLLAWDHLLTLFWYN